MLNDLKQELFLECGLPRLRYQAVPLTPEFVDSQTHRHTDFRTDSPIDLYIDLHIYLFIYSLVPPIKESLLLLKKVGSAVFGQHQAYLVRISPFLSAESIQI